MATIPQRKRMLQLKLTEDVIRRIKVQAAATGRKPGDVISDLAAEHLPPVQTSPKTELKSKTA